MKTCFYALLGFLLISVSSAANRPVSSTSTLVFNSSQNDSMIGLGTSEERQASTLSSGHEGGQLFAKADDNGNGKGKAKGKGRGKAKGRDKDKEKDGDTEEKEGQDAQPASTQPSAPTPAAAKPGTQPGASAPAAAAPVPKAKRSPAEVKAEMDQRLKRITALDKNTATSAARYAAISKETGVPLATLQAQRKAHPVGSGGILIANEMAKATGKPASTFLKQRLNGRDWNRIAAENKFDLAPVLPKLERLQKSMEAVPQPAKR